MKNVITIQHTQSIHHTNGMVGSWTDWELSDLGVLQAENIGRKLAKQLGDSRYAYIPPICAEPDIRRRLWQDIWEPPRFLPENSENAIWENVLGNRWTG